MQPFPHYYSAASSLDAGSGPVTLTSSGLPALVTSTPPEFDGPPGLWSPETLLVAAVVDCFVLTFRGVARANGLAWTRLEVEGTGRLERPERASQFTRFDLQVRLTLPEEAADDLATRVLRRAEDTCLITQSMKASTHLHVHLSRQSTVAA